MSIELGMVLATRLGLGEAHELPSGLMRIEIPLQPGRCSLFDGVCGSVLLDASYNASPKSMLSTLQQAIQLRTQLFPEHDLIYCLGDMRELGDFTETEHRQLAGIL